MTPEQLANAILSAAGTSLRNYMPSTREAILRAAEDAIDSIRADDRAGDPTIRVELGDL